MYLLKFFLIIVISIIYQGCTQKTTIISIKPATVHDKDLKNIAIDKFENDDISLASNIKSIMNETKFNNKNYFTIVNREETDKILQEQKLQDSGIVNINKEKRFGLSEIDSIITGSVNSSDYNTNIFYEKRTDFDKCLKYKTKDGNKYCVKYNTYIIRCKNYNYNIDATITINKITNSEIIFSKNFNKKLTLSKCQDQNKIIPTTTSIYSQISQIIAKEFVSFITPSFDYISVNLKDEPDIKYSNIEQSFLEKALKLMKLNEIEKANDIFHKLVLSTNAKSITALYNYALSLESLGELNKAYEYYNKAYNLNINNELDEDILSALNRVKKNIDKKQKAYHQINFMQK